MKNLLFAYLLPFFVAQNTPTPTLFPVVHNARWGYINTNGDLVIPCQFDNAQYFSEGLAAVRLGGFYGYIDTAGRWAIPPQYDYAFPFSEGFAIAHEDENTVFY